VLPSNLFWLIKRKTQLKLKESRMGKRREKSQLKLIWEKGMEMMQIPRRRELAIRRPRGHAESLEIGHMAEKMNLLFRKCRRIRFSYMGAQLPTPLP
jgi:hypothetical protein